MLGVWEMSFCPLNLLQLVESCYCSEQKKSFYNFEMKV